MKAQYCFRFNLRTVVGTVMAVLGSLYLTVWPIITTEAGYKGVPEEYMWGWPAVLVLCGSMMLAWGEFCKKGDC